MPPKLLSAYLVLIGPTDEETIQINAPFSGHKVRSTILMCFTQEYMYHVGDVHKTAQVDELRRVCYN